MFQTVLFLTILATVTNKKGLQNIHLVDLVEELCKNGGKWILAAAGSNGNHPPDKSCVELTVSKTDANHGCILVAHNHSIHTVKEIEILGVNEKNETEMLSKAPIHQYMVKINLEENVLKEFNKEVDWDVAIGAPMCWDLKVHEIKNSRYIVTPIDETTDRLYLIAVNARLPIPEYQVLILTKTKIRKRYLEKLINIIHFKNFVLLEDRLDNQGLLADHNLPRLQIKCAEGFNIHDPYDTINQEILDMKFNSKSHPFSNTDFKTVLVKYH